MNNLAFTWKYMSGHKDALDLIQTCPDPERLALGLDHPDTQSTLATIDAWLFDEENNS
jgi:hypothetical protein